MKSFQPLAKGCGDLLAQRERHFRAGPDIGAACSLCLHDAGVRLDICLMHRFGRKGIFDDDVGFAEPRLDIALFPVHVDKDVARRFDRMKQAAIAAARSDEAASRPA